MSHEVNVCYQFSDDDLKKIVVAALRGPVDNWFSDMRCLKVGYWACLWSCLKKSGVQEDYWRMREEDIPTASDVFKILLDGGTLQFLQDDGDDEACAQWDMDMPRLLKGIGLAIKNQNWNGDMSVLDTKVADIVFQYALLGTIAYE